MKLAKIKTLPEKDYFPMTSTNKSTMPTEMTEDETCRYKNAGLRHHKSNSTGKQNVLRLHTEQNNSFYANLSLIASRTSTQKHYKSPSKNQILLEGRLTQSDQKPVEKSFQQTRMIVQTQHKSYDEKFKVETKSSLEQFYLRSQKQVIENIPERFKGMSEILETKRREIANAMSIAEFQLNKEIIVQTDIGDEQTKYIWEERWADLYQNHLKCKEIGLTWKDYLLSEKQSLHCQNKLYKGVSKPNIKYYAKLDNGLMSLEEIDVVGQQLSLALDDRDYYELDKSLQSNKFLSQFAKTVRIDLMENAVFLKVDKNHVILSDTNLSGLIYIILRGNFGVYATMQTSFGDKVELEFGSFSDGQHFGEKNLVARGAQTLADQQFKIFNQHTLMRKRFTVLKEIKLLETKIVAREDSIMVAIQSDIFNNILMKSVEEDLQQRIKILRKVNLFQSQDKGTLLILAGALSQEQYKIGDIVLKESKEICYMYIVVSGQLKSCVNQRQLRSIRNEQIKMSPQHFKFKNNQMNSRVSSIQSTIHSFVNNVSGNKSFNDGFKMKVGENLMEYTEHTNLGIFNVGDIICGRALLAEDDYELKRQNFPNLDSFRHAKLSIITNSKEAEVYTLSYKQYLTLPEQLQLHLRDKILLLREFDDYDVDLIKEQQCQWSTTKQAYCRSLLKRKNIFT